MFGGLWYFRGLIFMELVYGIYNPSLKDLGQSTWKKVYCLFVLVTLSCCTVFRLLFEVDRKHTYIMEYVLVTMNLFVCAYYIVRALVDYKTKIYGILNLAAVENLKVNKRNQHFKEKLYSSSICMNLLSNIVLTNMNFILWFFENTIANNFILFEVTGITMFLFIGCYWYLKKISNIRISNYQLFLISVERFTTEAMAIPEHGRFRKQAWSEVHDDPYQVLALMRQTEGVLHQTEVELPSWFRVYIVWATLIAGVMVPLTFLYVVQFHNDSFIGIAITVSYCLVLVANISTLIVCSEEIIQIRCTTMSTISVLLAVTNRFEDKRPFRQAQRRNYQEDRRGLSQCERGTLPEDLGTLREHVSRKQLKDKKGLKHHERSSQQENMVALNESEESKWLEDKRTLKHNQRINHQKNKGALKNHEETKWIEDKRALKHNMRINQQKNKGALREREESKRIEERRNLRKVERANQLKNKRASSKSGSSNELEYRRDFTHHGRRAPSQSGRSNLDDRRIMRHHLLSGYHRQFNFDCYLFNLEYPLLLTIFDTSLLVICTMLSD